MNRLIDSVISVIKVDNLNPRDKTKVIKSLSQCVRSDRLIACYINNLDRVMTMRYTYETKKELT